MDLRFYQFMGNLVKGHKDTVMKDDYQHWQEKGFFDGFESYIQQSVEQVPYDPSIRDAWIKELIASQKAEKQGKTGQIEKEPRSSGPQGARTCRELLQMMPRGFNPDTAEGLEAVYQFELSGEEAFVAHLIIADGTCTYADGPADQPSVVVKSPSDVWLAISRGELDGQQAFMSGKYTVKGDLTLLMRLRTLFSRR
jgi:putative sterol carrier protein